MGSVYDMIMACGLRGGLGSEMNDAEGVIWMCVKLGRGFHTQLMNRQC